MSLRYPIGEQDFPSLREDGMVYVDKTSHIYRLLSSGGKYFFLSRPRRFGKSLLVSTLKALFEGRKSLFDGLWIYDKWDWSKRHPVVHISLDATSYRQDGLEKALSGLIKRQALLHGIAIAETSAGTQLEELIFQLYRQTGQRVVVLIDEYDKALLDFLDDPVVLADHQQVLQGFYGVLKPASPYLEFVFLTGVSKFAKVSVFSSLNNLEDITFSPDFVDGVGITEAELQTYFRDRLQELATQKGMSYDAWLAQVRYWYNGYSWDGTTRVYNPFSTLSFLKRGQFSNYWIETGVPSSVVRRMVEEKHEVDLELVEVGQDFFEGTSIYELPIRTLLFQAGFLTVKSVTEDGLYQIGYPNEEVRQAMYLHLLNWFQGGERAGLSSPVVVRMARHFEANALEEVVSGINAIFSGIPYNLFIADQERYYHAVLFIVFQLLSINTRVEVHCAGGRTDMVVQTQSHTYILEFKLNESAEAALAQIHAKGYAVPYLHQGRSVVAVGINFDGSKKQVGDWKQERLSIKKG